MKGATTVPEAKSSTLIASSMRIIGSNHHFFVTAKSPSRSRTNEDFVVRASSSNDWGDSSCRRIGQLREGHFLERLEVARAVLGLLVGLPVRGSPALGAAAMQRV